MLLGLSVLLNLAGAFATWQAFRYRRAIGNYQEWLRNAERKAREVEARMLAENPYAEDNRRLQADHAPGQGPAAVFYGASITRNWDFATYFPGEDFVNRGMGGKILPYLTLHFRENVIALHPRFVVIKACAINMTPELPGTVVRESFTNLCDLARANGITPVVATMLPATREAEGYFRDYSVAAHIRQFNEWAVDFSREKGYPLVDYYTVLADEDGFLRESLSQDALHPSAEGYRRMTDAFRTVWDRLARNVGPTGSAPGGP
jgi:hypothetical protein